MREYNSSRLNTPFKSIEHLDILPPQLKSKRKEFETEYMRAFTGNNWIKKKMDVKEPEKVLEHVEPTVKDVDAMQTTVPIEVPPPINQSIPETRPEAASKPPSPSTIEEQTQTIESSFKKAKPHNQERITKKNKAGQDQISEVNIKKRSQDGEKKAALAQYGQGNTNPVVPEHYMKTFNVNVPEDQVYLN
jgi:hypothetical protein